MNVILDEKHFKFTARPESIGTSEEELTALLHNKISPERTKAIKDAAENAAAMLGTIIPVGRC